MARLMKNILTKILMAAVLLGAVQKCHATDIGYSGPFVGTEGTASVSGGAAPATYTRNFNTTGDRVTLQIVSSTYTLATSTTFTSANYVVNTPTITLASTNYTTGEQVLYVGTTSISGLTTGTTYFISVISPNTNGVSSKFKLSTTSTAAVAGVGVVLASSSTVSNTYTLTPLTFANGNGGIQLQTSNDNVNFVSVTTGNYGVALSSVSFASGGGDVVYDLGPIQYKYLRLKVTAPSAGAMNYTVTSNERYSNIH